MRIVTDSAADLTAEELEEYKIISAPLFINFPNGSVNAADITPDEFYSRLEAMKPNVPTTAQPSVGNFRDLYQEVEKETKEIFSIHISSGLSGTINSARLGLEALKDEIDGHLWDTLTLSGGQRFQVLTVALGYKAGWSVEKIIERLKVVRDNTEVIYTLETLDYLAKGGRIGRVQALMGSVLKIKPVINVSHIDGKYNTVTKTRTIPTAIEAITENLLGIYGKKPLWLTVLHGQFQSGAQLLTESLTSTLTVAKIETRRISPVLGVHTGPGIVGVAALPIELMEDLL